MLYCNVLRSASEQNAADRMAPPVKYNASRLPHVSRSGSTLLDC